MTKRIVYLGLIALTCYAAAMAQECNWSLMPKAGMTVATLAGEDAEYLLQWSCLVILCCLLDANGKLAGA